MEMVVVHIKEIIEGQIMKVAEAEEVDIKEGETQMKIKVREEENM
jgi:hypothetical protein